MRVAHCFRLSLTVLELPGLALPRHFLRLNDLRRCQIPGGIGAIACGLLSVLSGKFCVGKVGPHVSQETVLSDSSSIFLPGADAALRWGSAFLSRLFIPRTR